MAILSSSSLNAGPSKNQSHEVTTSFDLCERVDVVDADESMQLGLSTAREGAGRLGPKHQPPADAPPPGYRRRLRHQQPVHRSPARPVEEKRENVRYGSKPCQSPSVGTTPASRTRQCCRRRNSRACSAPGCTSSTPCTTRIFNPEFIIVDPAAPYFQRELNLFDIPTTGSLSGRMARRRAVDASVSASKPPPSSEPSITRAGDEVQICAIAHPQRGINAQWTDNPLAAGSRQPRPDPVRSSRASRLESSGHTLMTRAP